MRYWLALLFVPVVALARPAPVGVDTVASVPYTQTLPLVGQVVAVDKGTVSATLAGQVAEVLVREGDQVTAGQPLLRVNTNRFEARRAQQRALLAQARADLSLANTELARILELRGKAAFSQAEADRRASAVTAAEARVAAARATLQTSQIDLDEAELKAPFNAVVLVKHTQAGAWLNPGSPAFDLVSVEAAEVVVDVPSAQATLLSPGTPVQAMAANGTTVTLEVRTVVPTEDGATRTRPVRLRQTGDARLVDGARLTVQLPTGVPRDVVSVHKDAVLRQGMGAMVYVIDEGKAAPRPVQLGAAVGDRLEVLEGLNLGDVTVIKGNERLRPGQEVVALGGNS